MGLKLGYSFSNSYNNMTELDKMLMFDYWREYDQMSFYSAPKYEAFADWFIHEATAPEIIRRARQFLIEHNYIIEVKESVLQHAHDAGENMRQNIKR
jgi:hypothetical protein